MTEQEPKRPPLDWAKSTPFDPFKDYHVERDVTLGDSKETGPRHPLAQSPDLQPTGPQPSKIWGARNDS